MKFWSIGGNGIETLVMRRNEKIDGLRSVTEYVICAVLAIALGCSYAEGQKADGIQMKASISAPVSGVRDSAEISEYAVKATFIFKFATFVEWPAGAFEEGAENFKIGILGEDPFREILDKTLQDRMIKGKVPVVKRSSTLDELLDCQIIYIARSERGLLDDTLSKLGEMHILTLGDTDEFAQKGGIIRLYYESEKIRFEINLDAARRADLKISSHLLQLGRLLPHTEPKEK